MSRARIASPKDRRLFHEAFAHLSFRVHGDHPTRTCHAALHMPCSDGNTSVLCSVKGMEDVDETPAHVGGWHGRRRVRVRVSNSTRPINISSSITDICLRGEPHERNEGRAKK